MPREIQIADPLAIMFRQDGDVIVHIHPPVGFGPKDYGLLACDFVRHAAAALKVDEAAVWEWVDKERQHHTTDITQVN